MTVINEDNRQQVHHGDKHAAKHAWWSAHGIEVVRCTIKFGDYTVDGSNVAVDTKASLDEIMANLGAGYRRLDHECRRAFEAGYRIVFLIEAGGLYAEPSKLSTVPGYVCRRCAAKRTGACRPCDPSQKCAKRKGKPFQGYQLVGRMKALHRKYGAEFEFVDPEDSARRICELLGVAYE